MKISVVMPVFNSARTIRGAIESYANQRYENKELIIVDGGSQDDTAKIVEEYGDAIDRFVSEPDKGYADAFNKGIRMSTGDFVIMLAADDRFLVDAFERFENTLEPDTQIWCGSVIFETAYGYSISHSDNKLEALRRSCSLRNPATFYRREIFDDVGYFSTNYKSANDREFFLRCYTKGLCFQIEQIPIALFLAGGISDLTENPLAIIEDREISIAYGMDERDANQILRDRLLHERRKKAVLPILKFMNRIGAMTLLYGLTGRASHSITKSQLRKLGVDV